MENKSLCVVGDSTKPKKQGRPKKSINWDRVVELCGYQASVREVARDLEISVNTLQDHIRHKFDMTWSEFFNIHRQVGFLSLRQKQFHMAMAGSEKLLIFLGKNWLGQSENVQVSFREEKLGEFVDALDAIAIEVVPNRDE